MTGVVTALTARSTAPSGRTAVVNVVLGNRTFNLNKCLATGKVETSLIVDLGNLDYYLVAHLNNRFNRLNALDVKLAYVDKPLFSGGYLNKGTEAHKAGDLALVYGADLGILGNGLDYAQRPLAIVKINCGDVDRTVLFNVDFNVAIGTDLLNNLAALAYDSLILSTSILVESILGAYFESSARGSGIALSIISSRI